MRLSESSDIPSSLIDTFELTLSRGIDFSTLDSQSRVYDLEFPKLSHAIELAGGVNASDDDLMAEAFATTGDPL